MKNNPIHAISYTRFSSPEQAKGDSYRRQTEKAAAYCARKGLTLLEKGEYFDAGVSGFHGKNKKVGQLADLLADARSGVIPHGTRLIVESLDRLGRDEVGSQLSFFTKLIEAGLVIVTLGDREQEYDANSDFTALIVALSIMGRANDESATKSMRSKSVWASKKKNMMTKPITSVVPGWLEIKDGKICEISKRVALVREMFALSMEGMGRRVIAKKLNERKEPTFGSSKIWHDTVIRSILRNRSVLGEYAPHSREGSKKVSEGESIAGYYPAIIDEDTFLTVQHRLTSRIKRGGRGTYKAGNLFSSRMKCLCCGFPVHYTDKGRSYTYLNCSNRVLAQACDAPPCNYPLAEKAILGEMTQIDFRALMSPESTQRTSDQVAALTAKVAGHDKKMNNLMDVLQDGTLSSPAIVARLAALEKEKNTAAAELNELVGSSEAKNKARHLAEEAAEEAKQFLHLAEHEETRLRLKKQIDDLLTRVYISHDGTGFNLLMIFTSGGIGYYKEGAAISYKFETGDDGRGDEPSLRDQLAAVMDAKSFKTILACEPQLFDSTPS